MQLKTYRTYIDNFPLVAYTMLPFSVTLESSKNSITKDHEIIRQCESWAKLHTDGRKRGIGRCGCNLRWGSNYPSHHLIWGNVLARYSMFPPSSHSCSGEDNTGCYAWSSVFWKLTEHRCIRNNWEPWITYSYLMYYLYKKDNRHLFLHYYYIKIKYMEYLCK